MATIADLQVQIGADIKRLERGLSKAQRRIQDAGRSMQRVGSRLTMAVTAPLAAVGGAALKSASDFEASMTRIETLVGLSRSQVQGMEADVLALSRTTGTSAQQLSEALFAVTSAGARGSEAMEILERAGKASAAGLGETREIARATTAAMQAYGKENLSAARATDVFAAIVREGNLRAEDLAPTLGRVIGIASQVGVSFEEVGASIATFTRLGVNAEEATTALRGVMNQLISPTRGAKEALAEVGLSTDALRSQIQDDGLAATLRMLVGEFEGNEEALSKVIPNVRAMSAVLGTAGSQGEQYSQIVQNINNSQGLLGEAFRRTTQTAKFQFGQAINELRTDAIELGTALMPLATKVMKAVSDAMETARQFSSQYREQIVALSIAIGGLGPVLATIGTALVALTSPIGVVVAALGALAVAVTYIWDNWKAVKERISNLTWWRNTLIRMVQMLVEFNPISLLIKGINQLLSYLGTATVPNFFEGMSSQIGKLRDDTVEYENEFGSLTDAIINGSQEAWRWFGRFTDGLLSDSQQFRVMGDVFTNVGNTISDIMKAIKDDVSDTADSAKQDFKIMGDIFTYVGNSVSQLTSGVTQDLSDVEKRAQAMQRAIGNGVTDMVETFAKGLGRMAAGVSTFKGVFSGLKGIGMSVLESLANLAQRVGRIAIAVGVGIQAIKEALRTLNPFVAIAAGTALIGLGAWAKSSLQKAAKNKRAEMQANGGVPALASGGLAFGPTLAVVGDNANARSNPEVIAPLDKLQGMMASSGGGATKVEGVIRGSDIHLANERGKNKFR